MEIREADVSDLMDLSKLFDGYRQFYGQPSNEAESRVFLGERLARKDSVILIAIEEGATVGFVQLYPSFSSVAMRRIFVLNDLLVVPGARNGGVATTLLERAESFAVEAGAVRLTLATEIANRAARVCMRNWVGRGMRCFATLLRAWERSDKSLGYYQKSLSGRNVRTPYSPTTPFFNGLLRSLEEPFFR